jgi:Bacterial Ig domain
MQTFRYSPEPISACNACCCHPGRIAPGVTEKIAIDWSQWREATSGLGLVRRPQIDLAPVNIDRQVSTQLNTPLTGSVAIGAADPESAPLTFSVVPGQSTRHGVLALAGDGTYTYTPVLGYVGHDQAWIATDDGVNAPVLTLLQITVQPLAPACPYRRPASTRAGLIPNSRLSPRPASSSATSGA